jgi:hypothetical protein
MPADSTLTVALVAVWTLGAGAILCGGLWLSRRVEGACGWAADRLAASVVRARERAGAGSEMGAAREVATAREWDVCGGCWTHKPVTESMRCESCEVRA